MHDIRYSACWGNSFCPYFLKGYVKQLKNFEYLYAVESDWVKNFSPSGLGFGLGVEVMPIGKYVGAGTDFESN